MDALISSNQGNPLQHPDKADNSGGGAATATVTDAPVTSRASSSNQSSLVPPERRHSTSASDWSQTVVANGSVVKKNGVGPTLSNGSGHSRRHSLPINGNGCIVALKETNSSSKNEDEEDEDEEEDDEEISETAALTAV
jgi:hypothetical protein